jgi:hypothetical protein
MTTGPERDYVCHGVSWTTRDPQLVLSPLPDGPLVHVPLIGHRLGFRASAGRWCTGWYRFVDTVYVEPVPCPDRAPAVQEGQCLRCLSEDNFRMAHQFHLNDRVPAALRRYMEQRHWLYLATFADGSTKVGTASDTRKRARLDEQGALIATYMASASDGAAVRHLEDAITRDLQIPQSVRSASKLKALVSMNDLSTASSAHAGHVSRASDALAGMGVHPVLEPWEPPVHGARIRRPHSGRMLYPHDLRDGEHGFTVVASIGSQALVTLDGDDEGDYLLDLGQLKGRRITVGAFTSPTAAVQSSLF